MAQRVSNTIVSNETALELWSFWSFWSGGPSAVAFNWSVCSLSDGQGEEYKPDFFPVPIRSCQELYTPCPAYLHSASSHRPSQVPVCWFSTEIQTRCCCRVGGWLTHQTRICSVWRWVCKARPHWGGSCCLISALSERKAILYGCSTSLCIEEVIQASRPANRQGRAGQGSAEQHRWLYFLCVYGNEGLIFR